MTEITYTPQQIAALRAEHRQRALDLITGMRRHGHALRYIAGELQRKGVASPAGLPGQRWDEKQVRRLIQAGAERRALAGGCATASRSGRTHHGA